MSPEGASQERGTGATPRRRGGYGKFESVELLPEQPPYPAELLERLGATRLHCGCGLGLRPGWLNTDMLVLKNRARTSFTEPDRIARIDGSVLYLEHDATTAFPLADGCLEWVYSEHFIEHLTLQETVGWLTEMRRLLRPGGHARISTPDLHRYARGYADSRDGFFPEHARRLREIGAPDVSERGGWMLNQIFYQWGHKWIYDLEEIRHVAGRAGFDPQSAVERSFRQGADLEVAALDREWRSDESLYVEITKT